MHFTNKYQKHFHKINLLKKSIPTQFQHDEDIIDNKHITEIVIISCPVLKDNEFKKQHLEDITSRKLHKLNLI